ncbi:uncharacterized protein LOC62_07G009774 [Vanrija pseudolonga]|uniref:Uncharacterized protein n=1 Tax=Vanrija pseudolonga TaxID=143232 RepID=A0AAF1BUM8_9TREE|nr:hypothetical protein LOC62_07G009774 [Vanrija pseudolonga]
MAAPTTTPSPLPASYSRPADMRARLATDWWNGDTLEVLRTDDQALARVPVELLRTYHDPAFLLDTIVRACSEPAPLSGSGADADPEAEDLEYTLSPSDMGAILASSVVRLSSSRTGEPVALIARQPSPPALEDVEDEDDDEDSDDDDDEGHAVYFRALPKLFRAALVKRDPACPVTGLRYHHSEETHIVPLDRDDVYARLGLEAFTVTAGLVCDIVIRRSFDRQAICLLRNADRVDMLALATDHPWAQEHHGRSFSYGAVWPDPETAPSKAALDWKARETLLSRCGVGR